MKYNNPCSRKTSFYFDAVSSVIALLRSAQNASYGPMVLVIHVMCLILLPGLANRVILGTRFQFSWDVLGIGQREA